MARSSRLRGNFVNRLETGGNAFRDLFREMGATLGGKMNGRGSHYKARLLVTVTVWNPATVPAVRAFSITRVSWEGEWSLSRQGILLSALVFYLLWSSSIFPETCDAISIDQNPNNQSPQNDP
jgi:hypothetical protein